MKKKDLLIVASLFYLGWFGSVYLAKSSFSYLALIFPALLLGFLAYKKDLNLKNVLFALIISLIGMTFDSLLIQYDYVTSLGQTILVIPIWLIAIWFLYSFSMIKLGPHLNPPLWLAILLGMIFGPLSYKSGEAFQVLSFTKATTIYIYSLFWCAMFPAVLILSKRFT